MSTPRRPLTFGVPPSFTASAPTHHYTKPLYTSGASETDTTLPCVVKQEGMKVKLTLGSFDLLAALRSEPFACFRQGGRRHSICAKPTPRNPRSAAPQSRAIGGLGEENTNGAFCRAGFSV